MLPGEDDVSKALNYLASTDEAEANAKALVKAVDEGRKIIKAQVFLAAKGTAAERTEIAYASPEYQAQIERQQDATADHALLHTKRKRAELMIEVWRSTNANRRKGNV